MSVTRSCDCCGKEFGDLEDPLDCGLCGLGHAMHEGDQFCCGHFTCPDCGQWLQEDSELCVYCGSDFLCHEVNNG